MGEVWFVALTGVVGAVVGMPLGLYAATLVTRPRPVSVRTRLGMSIACAGLFAIVALTFGPAWELPAYLFFAAAAVVLGTVDLLEKRIPNAALYPSLVIFPVLLVLVAALTGAWSSLLGAAAGGAALFILYFILAVISPAGIGMGDVKLAALIGMALGFLGWTPILVGGMAGFLIGGLTSLIALLSGRAGMKTALPYGPAMLAGAFLGILLA